MVVETMKKKRIMKITSGSDAVEMPGKSLLPFFFITAMAYFFMLRGSASEIFRGTAVEMALLCSSLSSANLEPNLR